MKGLVEAISEWVSKHRGKANRSVGVGSDASLREVEVVLWGVVTTE